MALMTRELRASYAFVERLSDAGEQAEKEDAARG